MPSPSPSRRGLVAGLVLTTVAAPLALAVGAPAAAAPAPKVAKSLVIGIDGATFSTLAGAGLTAIPALQAEGVTAPSSLYAQPMAPTLSGPGWSSIATGVWPDKHRVVDNSFTGARYDLYPDYLTRLNAAKPAAETLVVGNWDPITSTVFGPGVDTRVDGTDDADVTAKAVAQLIDADPDATFVHLDEVDGAGHAGGTDSPAYAEALRVADAQVGQMVAAVRSRATYKQEKWLIVVTADHGHTPTGGHGGASRQERETFVIASGGPFAAGSVRHDLRIVDIAPTVLGLHGVARPRAWGLDGIPARSLVPDAFDSLRPLLQPAVDEAVSGTGWTHTAPDGWSIDNSRMPEGGVTEWRGWAFTTDEFWSNVQLGQFRETNVRSRDIFAVADSDEWDDKAHDAGQFDSTLVSPEFDVAGAKRAVVGYATTYAVDGPQTARVLASFDGGEPVLVKDYTAAANTVESLQVKVPAGASTMQLRFAYTGTNSYFWTVDQVTVRAAR